jgi:hypothetical protein
LRPGKAEIQWQSPMKRKDASMRSRSRMSVSSNPILKHGLPEESSTTNEMVGVRVSSSLTASGPLPQASRVFSEQRRMSSAVRCEPQGTPADAGASYAATMALSKSHVVGGGRFTKPSATARWRSCLHAHLTLATSPGPSGPRARCSSTSERMPSGMLSSENTRVGCSGRGGSAGGGGGGGDRGGGRRGGGGGLGIRAAFSLAAGVFGLVRRAVGLVTAASLAVSGGGGGGGVAGDDPPLPSAICISSSAPLCVAGRCCAASVAPATVAPASVAAASVAAASVSAAFAAFVALVAAAFLAFCAFVIALVAAAFLAFCAFVTQMLQGHGSTRSSSGGLPRSAKSGRREKSPARSSSAGGNVAGSATTSPAGRAVGGVEAIAVPPIFDTALTSYSVPNCAVAVFWSYPLRSTVSRSWNPRPSLTVWNALTMLLTDSPSTWSGSADVRRSKAEMANLLGV